MARKPKNKTGKGWISKVINHIKSKWQQVNKEYWAPVAIALGFTALLNVADVFPAGWVNLIFCVIMFGFGLPLLWMLPRKDRKLLSSRILITAGFPVFFFGNRIRSSCPITGGIIIAIGLTAIVIGLCLSYYLPLRSIDSKDSIKRIAGGKMAKRKIADISAAKTVISESLEAQYGDKLKSLSFHKCLLSSAGKQKFWVVEGFLIRKKGIFSKETENFRYRIDPSTGDIIGYEEIIPNYLAQIYYPPSQEGEDEGES